MAAARKEDQRLGPTEQREPRTSFCSGDNSVDGPRSSQCNVGDGREQRVHVLLEGFRRKVELRGVERQRSLRLHGHRTADPSDS